MWLSLCMSDKMFQDLLDTHWKHLEEGLNLLFVTFKDDESESFSTSGAQSQSGVVKSL